LTSGLDKPLLLDHRLQSLETLNLVILKDKFVSMGGLFR